MVVVVYSVLHLYFHSLMILWHFRIHETIRCDWKRISKVEKWRFMWVSVKCSVVMVHVKYHEYNIYVQHWKDWIHGTDYNHHSIVYAHIIKDLWNHPFALPTSALLTLPPPHLTAYRHKQRQPTTDNEEWLQCQHKLTNISRILLCSFHSCIVKPFPSFPHSLTLRIE